MHHHNNGTSTEQGARITFRRISSRVSCRRRIVWRSVGFWRR